jgi:adenine-specific DNA-methyltransferase
MESYHSPTLSCPTRRSLGSRFAHQSKSPNKKMISSLKTSEIKKAHRLGQYFTKNDLLKKKLCEMIQNEPELILEPSVGRGDLVVYCKEKKPNVSFDMYEIDPSIDFLVPKEKIIFGDFLEKKIEKKYMTIIANPPFVRTKNGNLYIDFIEKCFHLLEIHGEMIFIIPSDFFHLTSASKLLIRMTSEGSFTNIFHPNIENLFDDASIDVLIFRYQKTNQQQISKIIYNDNESLIHHYNGLITFSDYDNSISSEHISLINPKRRIKDVFDIFVGLVSGKDEVFKCDLGNIEVLIDENITKKFIYLDKFPSENEVINTYLLDNKDILLSRKIKKFNDKNWYQWGAPRNIKTMKSFYGEECIYIHNLTRKNKVAFIDKVQYFGGNLLMLKPKQKMTKEELDQTILFFNGKDFLKNFTYSGRFKIGHKQISDSLFYN